MKLNAGRCLLAAERRDVIKKVLFDAYNGNNEICKTVRGIVDWFFQCCEHLYDIGLLLKSTKKMSGERLDSLKHHVAFFFAHFVHMTSKENPSYHKMHVLLFHLIPFAEETGICGHARTEGFENTHFHMAAVKNVMKPIASTKVRIRTIALRTQTFLIQEVENRRKLIEENTPKYEPRGRRYSTDGYGKNLKYHEDIDDTSDEIVNNIVKHCFDGEEMDFFAADSGTLIPLTFWDAYQCFAKNKVLPEVTKVIFESDEFGSKAKRDSQFMA